MDTFSRMDTDALAKLVGVTANPNLQSVLSGLARFGKQAGLGHPHRLVPYMAQLSHETGGFKYDREIWGPTAAQKRYETRTDLGNTAAVDGDGYKYRGRTGIQITGGHNVRSFRDWCVEEVDRTAPNFETDPDLMNTDPWEGLGPIWYWTAGNPTKKSLNLYADDGNFEMITRRINGGLNGYEDRCSRYTAMALTALEYLPGGVKEFQKDAGLRADGIAGPLTRTALHKWLRELPEVSFVDPFPKPGMCSSAFSTLLGLGLMSLFPLLKSMKGLS